MGILISIFAIVTYIALVVGVQLKLPEHIRAKLPLVRDPMTWRIGLVAVLAFAGVSLFFELYSPYQNCLKVVNVNSDYGKIGTCSKVTDW
jgi:hypothetical protein